MSDTREEIEALIGKHPFTGMGGRIIYEAPKALADGFEKMLAEAREQAWNEGFSAALSQWRKQSDLENPYRKLR